MMGDKYERVKNPRNQLQLERPYDSVKSKIFVGIVSILFTTMSLTSSGQTRMEKDSFKSESFSLTLDKEELTGLVNNCGSILNKISFFEDDNLTYNISLCTSDFEDITFIKKGYLTVIEHYSSPVGWSKYFVFDFCKKRIIETKTLGEGTSIEWTSFIDFTSDFKKSTIAKIIEF
jgi:hypothetical protein